MKKDPLRSLLKNLGRGKDSVQKLTKCQVLNGGKNHHGGENHLCSKKDPLRSLLKNLGRGKDSVQKLTKCQVLNGGKNHHGGENHLCSKKDPLRSLLKNLGRGGFEPPYPRGNRFTVCRL